MATDTQGRIISELVRTMIEELDAYTGRNRARYDAFRDAKRALFKIRPDLAPALMRFVVSQTHWK